MLIGSGIEGGLSSLLQSYPAPSTNAPMQAPLNAADAPTYTPLSSVEGGGTMVQTLSLLLAAAMVVPVAMSITATVAQTTT
jgi:hypothetical protein